MKLLPILLAPALGAAPTTAKGPEPAPVVEVSRALLQLRYQRTSVSVLPGLETILRHEYPSEPVAADATRTIRDTARAEDGLSLRRAWLELESHPMSGLSGEIRLDLATLLHDEPPHAHPGGAGPHHMVEVFCAELQAFQRLTLRLGLTEIPFSLFELVHDPGLELAEKGPAHELLEHLGFAGSDVGMIAGIAPFREKSWLDLQAGFVGGLAAGAQRYTGPGLLVARALTEPVAAIRLGAGIAWRPRPVDDWLEEQRFRYQIYDRGVAYGVDGTVSLGNLQVRLEWLAGDRTDNDVDTPRLLRRGDARSFQSAWGMAAYRLPLGDMALIPAVRGEWLDTDREHDDAGGIIHLSAALSLDFAQRWRLLWDLSQHYVQPGTRNWEFGILRYDTDATTGVVQVQVAL